MSKDNDLFPSLVLGFFKSANPEVLLKNLELFFIVKSFSLPNKLHGALPLQIECLQSTPTGQEESTSEYCLQAVVC